MYANKLAAFVLKCHVWVQVWGALAPEFKP